MKQNFWKVLMAGAMAASVLAGCASTPAGNDAASGDDASGETAKDDTAKDDADKADDKKDDGEAAKGEPAGDTVKIGLNFELSGAVSSYGTMENKGAKLAIKQFNEKEDKPFTAEAVEIDDKSDAAESTTAATKLIEQDKVAGIVGPATSGASIATYQIATDKQVPVISPSATQVGATTNSTNGQVYDYAWRVCFEDTYQGKAMAMYAYETLGCKNAVIFNEVSDYGQGLAKAFKEEFETLGGKVVDQQNYTAGDTDFSAAITGLKNKEFDVAYIAGYYTEAGKIIKQMKDDGIDVPIVGADGFDSTELVSQAGEEYATNLYFTTAYSEVNASDELKSFIEAYTAEYNEDPNMFAALAYDATNLLLDSLVASGETGPALNEAIQKADFTGVTGSFTFDEATHTPIKSVLVVKMENGKQTDAQEVTVD